MKKVIPYSDNIVWADNEIAQEFKAIIDTPKCRMYSGRRMKRIINRNRIRFITQKSKYNQ